MQPNYGRNKTDRTLIMSLTNNRSKKFLVSRLIANVSS